MNCPRSLPCSSGSPFRPSIGENKSASYTVGRLNFSRRSTGLFQLRSPRKMSTRSRQEAAPWWHATVAYSMSLSCHLEKEQMFPGVGGNLRVTNVHGDWKPRRSRRVHCTSSSSLWLLEFHLAPYTSFQTVHWRNTTPRSLLIL